MSKPDGGPAFSRAAFAPTNVGYEDVGIHDSQEGMSLRDWFAGQALAGILAQPRWLEQAKCDLDAPFPACVAEVAFMSADAMLAERSKTNAST